MEQPESFYDNAFANSVEYRGRPEDIIYYPVWTEVLSLLDYTERILECGCGTGQFAILAQERGYSYSLGLDFSKVALDLATARCPGLEFRKCDLRDGASFPDPATYDVVVFIEVLEHIENDLGILQRIPAGKHVIITVPSYGSDGHVRAFENAETVFDRFDGLCDFYVHRHTHPGGRIYILDGVMKPTGPD